MVLHPKKSRCMVIATRQKHQIKRITLELDINKQLIEQVDQHRVLGVILDNEYKWLPHLVNVMKTVSKNLYLLSQLRHYANADSLMIFYYAHILTYTYPFLLCFKPLGQLCRHTLQKAKFFSQACNKIDTS